MKPKNIIIILVVVVALIAVFYSFRNNNDEAAYIAGILRERDEKDRFMRTSAQSPFADNAKDFHGLSYYVPSGKYRIIADLRPIQNKKVILLTTNDGSDQRYLEYAYAEFDLDGFHHKLLILEIADWGAFHGKLFLAFGDETSAVETYGAGRYLDVVKMPGSKTITLDFNKAYNPYCAYNEKYSCPLPPAENVLRVAINAGEKSYK